VRLYTRKLPADHARRRREEIESDLFEHAADAQGAGVDGLRLDAEVLARVLVGAPADLTWRRAIREPQPRLALGGSTMSLSTSTSNRLLNILGGIVIAWVLFWTVGAAVIFEPQPDEQVSWQLTTFFMVVPLIGVVALAIGLKIRSRSPRRGLHLIVAGVLCPAVWLWFLPVYVPFMIAIIAIAASATPRKTTRIATA
jgi:hypothetical protein